MVGCICSVVRVCPISRNERALQSGQTCGLLQTHAPSAGQPPVALGLWKVAWGTSTVYRVCESVAWTICPPFPPLAITVRSQPEGQTQPHLPPPNRWARTTPPPAHSQSPYLVATATLAGQCARGHTALAANAALLHPPRPLLGRPKRRVRGLHRVCLSLRPFPATSRLSGRPTPRTAPAHGPFLCEREWIGELSDLGFGASGPRLSRVRGRATMSERSGSIGNHGHAPGAGGATPRVDDLYA